MRSVTVALIVVLSFVVPGAAQRPEPKMVARGADGGIRAFVARVDGHELQPAPYGGEAMMIDATGSTWDATTGTCVNGPLEGSILETVAVTPVYWVAWSGF